MGLNSALKAKFGKKLSRGVLHSPLTYKVVSTLLKQQAGNFSKTALYQTAQFAVKQTSAIYTGKKPAVWNTAFFPNELLYGLGLTPFSPEVASAMAAALDQAGPMIDRSEVYWTTRDTCSFHRCAMGLALEGMLPAPVAVVASSQPCDGAPKLMEHVARLYKCPMFLLDVPRSPTPEAEEYVAKQLEHMAYRLAAEIGTKPDKDKLAEALENANRTRRYWLKVNELRRSIPPCIKSEEALGSLVYLTFTAQGSSEMAEIYRLLYEELAARAEREAGKIRREQRYTRLLWLHLKPYFKNQLFANLESDLNATVVFEEMSHVYWEPLDPADPYRSLARKVLSYFGYGSIERRVDTIIHLAHRYKADAVVHFSHWGCRQSSGALIPLRDRLRKAGLPLLILDGDCVDNHQLGEGQLKTRLQAFVEMVRNKE
ncbi:MAG: 2-hydroxyacyl-CoA dehydratase [Peptococcaceae bacterium]|nr:2-hydroxyacyl-CoA dehydratase [Peptococcaceae bacterium]